jgi:hypothetical protein
LKIAFSIFAATTYLIFCAGEIFFLASAISTSFTRSTFVLGTFWARAAKETFSLPDITRSNESLHVRDGDQYEV